MASTTRSMLAVECVLFIWDKSPSKQREGDTGMWSEERSDVTNSKTVECVDSARRCGYTVGARCVQKPTPLLRVRVWCGKFCTAFYFV